MVKKKVAHTSIDFLVNTGKFIGGLIFLAVVLIILYTAIKYIKFMVNVHTAKPYVKGEYNPSPVLEEDKNTVTWIIHKYVPLHNAGSEWMAHAMNRYLIQHRSFHVNVITNTTPVNEFERVMINSREDSKRSTEVLRHCSVILTHHNQEPHAVRTAPIVKRPVVCVMHDHGRSNYLSEYAKLPYKDNIYLIHNSKWLEKYYSSFGFQSIIVHPPVFYQEYKTETTREYVTLINCNENKGGSVLIKIARRMPTVKFLGVKGAYNSQVTTNISNITYMNQTSYIKSVYGLTGILLMPSKEESWGRTAIEAMSSGIPVIAHPTPGLLESCGDAGIFCNRDDINAWVAAIQRLQTDKDYYKSISDRCLERAKELDPVPQLSDMAEWLKGLKWRGD